MTIGQKIMATGAALVAMTTALGLVSIARITAIEETASAITEHALPGLDHLNRMVAAAKENKFAMASVWIHASAGRQGGNRYAIQESERALQSEFQSFRTMIHTEAEQRVFADLMASHEQVKRGWDKVVAQVDAGKLPEASAVWLSECQPHIVSRAAFNTELLKRRRENSESSAAAMRGVAADARFWSIAILLATMAVSAVLVYFTVRDVNGSLRHTAEELGSGGEQLLAAAGQVAASSQSLSQGASEQAASIEQVSASMEQMGAMTRKNAENSEAASTMITETSSQVERSNTALQQMVESMNSIKTSSERVAKIIRTIDEIAFQTNILALNAAVEAARAGEAGMGFAVVADEVRNLAQRSATAAKDTASLIEESIENSNEGGRRLEQVAAAIRSITESVIQAKILVDEVSEASKQQTQGITQVTQAVTQVSSVTQMTAANAEESAAASEELNGHAERVRSLVGALRAMSDGAAGTVASHRVVARPGIGAPGRLAVSARKKAVTKPSHADEFPLEPVGKGEFHSF